MNWTVNITYKADDETLTEVCETHVFKNHNFYQILKWIEDGADKTSSEIESLSIWKNDITDEQD